jgi:hypothetical protein
VPPLLWRSSTLDILLVILTLWRWAFGLLSVQSYCFHVGKKFTRIVPFSS